MTKQEMVTFLKENGVEVKYQWGEKRLKEEMDKLVPVVKNEEPTTQDTEPAYSEEAIKHIADDLSGKHVRPIENITKDLYRDDEGLLRSPSGIIVPDSVIAGKTKTKWEYRVRTLSDVSIVEKVMYNGYTEFVREYSLSIHGQEHRKLAEQFAQKMAS